MSLNQIHPLTIIWLYTRVHRASVSHGSMVSEGLQIRPSPSDRAEPITQELRMSTALDKREFLNREEELRNREEEGRRKEIGIALVVLFTSRGNKEKAEHFVFHSGFLLSLAKREPSLYRLYSKQF